MVSKLAQNLIGSEIIKIGNQVNELKSQGAEIANLTIGDLDSKIYPIPTELKLNIQKSYDNDLTNYPPANGLLSLRKAVSKDLKIRWDLDYTPEDILIAGGSRPLIYATYKTIVDEGDKVIFAVPSWNNNHYSYLTSAQSIEIEVSPENNFLPIAEDIIPHLPNATLVSLCSPLNPTGTMFTKHQLAEICEAIIAENKRRVPNEKPLYLMYDQIYALLTFGDTEHYNPVTLYPEMKDYTIYIDGTSKSFAATGVRVGWSFGPTQVIDRMKALLTHVGAWAPKPEQQAVAEYLDNVELVNHFVDQYKGKLAESLEILHSGIQEMKTKGFSVDSIKPMGALYLTIKLDYIGKTTEDGKILKDSTDLVFYLIEKAGVALVPFSAFGNSLEMPWFRASVGACSVEDLQKMFPKLEAALSKLL